MGTWLIETERLQICEVDEAVAKQVAENVNDGDDMTSFMEAIPKSVLQDAIADTAQVLTFVETIASAFTTKDIVRFGAWEHATGDLVAYVGLSNSSTRNADIQIMVVKEYQGKGYGTELLAALIPFFFRHYDIDRIVYRLRANNLPSEKLVKRLGGILQEPNSRIEELTIKTYYIMQS